ncbi:DNA polymerase Y family protein [Paraburkholderia aspalathi]|uniref:Y-family DNA polymerase n=1 Tax=Paraburkholderia aspalathi TaxID=1324617 RepID=UPI0038B7D60A
MAVFVAIHLPRLSLEVFRPRWSSRAERGCVVLEREKVLVADAVAREAGVAAGMRRGGVITLAQDALVYDRDTAREHDVLLEVAYAVMRFSPMVAQCAEDTVLVDITASIRLFGGVRRICRAIRQILETIGVTGSISLAPTGQGAWLLSKCGQTRVLKLQSLARMLDTLPFEVVPEMRRYADWFSGLGCVQLSDIRRLPRAGLKKRCGVALLDSMDRAYGVAPEVFEWLQVPPSFNARVELPDRVEHAEAILFSARRLVVQLCGWLTAQQLALTKATVLLEHERGRDAIEPTAIEIALAEPTWHEEHLVRLLKERLGRIELSAAAIAVSLNATQVEAAEPPSDTLFPEPGGSAEDHNRLVELLVARLGSDNVERPAPTADHRPERANRWVPMQSPEKSVTVARGVPRPTWLLATPVKLLIRQHRPFYGSPLKLVSTAERVEAGWFDGEMTARDYFVGQAADMSCYWIYRERPSATSDEVVWYLHGFFG